jgi:hypothetical protein
VAKIKPHNIASGMECPSCGSAVSYHESDAVVYGKQYSKHGRYVCSAFPKCDTHVGCHPNRTPLGVLKNKEGRELAKKCHAIFDSFWKEKGLDRSDCYEFLADKLGIHVTDCHFGTMNNEELSTALKFLHMNRYTFVEQVNSSPLFEEERYWIRRMEEEELERFA